MKNKLFYALLIGLPIIAIVFLFISGYGGYGLAGLIALIALSLPRLRIEFAKGAAIRAGKKEVPMFWGQLRLLLWEPNEGLVILKNKQISQVIPAGDVPLDSQGGMKVIYPFNGEELRARIPLALRMMTWKDPNALTRESIQVSVEVSIWWKVRDLSAYVFNINRGVHVEQTRQELGLVEAAEAWLKTLTESTLRTLVSQASVAFIVSSKATSYLQVANRPDLSAPPTSASKAGAPEAGTPEAIADHLRQELSLKVKEYGIDIQRVEIQAVSLAKEIQDAIDRVWQASLLPARTEHEARAKAIELKAIADVIGINATAMNELLKNFQGSNFYGPVPFLDNIFDGLGKSPDGNNIAGDSNKPQLQTQLQDGGMLDSAASSQMSESINVFCPHCGVKVANTAKFCSQCGGYLDHS